MTMHPFLLSSGSSSYPPPPPLFPPLQAEVHSIMADGSVALHARSLKYGKLQNGVFTSVPSALVPRLKYHFVSLPCKVDIVLGLNGFIWLTEPHEEAEVAAAAGGAGGAATAEEDAAAAELGLAEAVERRKQAAAARTIGPSARERIARVLNCITALASMEHMVEPASIMALYNGSRALGLQAKEMLAPSSMAGLLAELQKGGSAGSSGGGGAAAAGF